MRRLGVTPAVVLAVLLVIGCSSHRKAEQSDLPGTDTLVCTSGQSFGFSILEHRDLPFPSDFYTVADASRRTGRRVWFPDEVTPLFQRAVSDFDFVTEAYEQLDGFSVVSPIYMPVSAPVDVRDAAGQIPSTSDAVMVFDYTPDSPDYGRLVPVKLEYIPDYEALSLRPRFSFAEQRTYLVVITDRLRTADGTCIEPSGDFQFLRDPWPDRSRKHYDGLSLWRTAYDPIWSFLAGHANLSPSSTLLAFTYTTQSVLADMQALYEATIEQTSELPPAVMDMQLQYPADDPDFGLKVKGFFEATDWQGEDGIIEFADGKPLPEGVNRVPFRMVLPRPDGPYEQPYPVVIFQHGAADRKEAILLHSGRFLAQTGMAAIAIDTVCYGERLGSPHYLKSVSCMFDLLHPLRTRDNFRQAVTEDMRLTQIISGIADYDILPEGGDGVPDLDPSRIYYVGESMGAMIGMLNAATNPDIDGYLLIVPSGYFTYLSRYQPSIMSLESALDWLQYTQDVRLAFEMLQGVLEAADPISYARYTAHPPDYVGGPKPMLFTVAAFDDLIPREPTEYVVRAAELPMVGPYVYTLPDVKRIEAPVYDRAYVQHDHDSHEFFYYENPVSLRARKQAQHFFRTLAESGRAEIIDP